jgi:energy-coupling factor transport system permease protein
MRSSLFSSYERPSFLSTLNPSVKLCVSIVFMVVATGIFDMVTLGTLFVLGLIGTLFLGRVHPQAVLKGLVPFALFALGYLWMNALFPRVDPDESTVLLRLGPVSVIEQGVLNGLTFGLRALGFGVYSMLFVSTTEPTDFVLSLVRQLRIPPRIAYGTLAAYRYLPMLESEFQQIRAAHRIRGVGEGMGLKGRIVQIYRYTVPLLASAIRQAGRVADAMESRGFTGSRERSYYREVRLRKRDGAYAAAALGLLGAVLLVSAHLGFLRLWSGTLWS